MKPTCDERLAALQAGDEATARERDRFKEASQRQPELAALSAELGTQREWLLALKDQPVAGRPAGDVERARAALRARIAEARPRWFGWPVWIPVGAGAALATIALVFASLPTGEPAPIELTAHHAAEAPALALRLPAPAPAVEARVSRRPRRNQAAPAPTLATAYTHVDEIVAREDGTLRLRVKTQNPNVVIYLFEGEAHESGGEE